MITSAQPQWPWRFDQASLVRNYTSGRERTRRVRLTIWRSFVPEIEENVWGFVRMSKMWGFCRIGIRKWVPSPTVWSITPLNRSKITALSPPSTVYSDVFSTVAAVPRPKAAFARLERNETAACWLPISRFGVGWGVNNEVRTTTTRGGEKFCLGFMEATTKSALMGQVYYPITWGLSPLITRQNYQKYKKIDWPGPQERTFTRLQHLLHLHLILLFDVDLLFRQTSFHILELTLSCSTYKGLGRFLTASSGSSKKEYCIGDQNNRIWSWSNR